MTISTETRKAGPYTCNGVTTAFSFSFKVFAASEVVVVFADEDGVETTLTKDSHYTVSLNADQNNNPGGSITTIGGSSPYDDGTITLTSDVDVKQETDITNGGGFFPNVLENVFDRLTIYAQQITERLGRSIRIPISDASGLTVELPTAANRALKFLGWDIDGNTTAVEGTSSGDASMTSFTPAGTGAVDSTAELKMREIPSVKDFGAVGDGTTDDTDAVEAANTYGETIYVPDGIYDTTIAANDLDGPFYGPGQIRDTANYKRGKYFSHISAAPASFGSHGSIDQAFNGDVSKVQFAVEHRISGAATLGQPTTGYTYTPEAYGFYEYLQNLSGYNHGTANADGRTLAAMRQMRVYQAGQGDCAAISVIGFVDGTKAGSTHFLANPAVAMCYGQFNAGEDGVYLNPYETTLQDDGYDVAGIGTVINLDRTVATGAKSAFWGGARYQSIGSAFADSIISAIGKFKVGIDLAAATLNLDTTAAAVSMRSGQRVYFNNTAVASGNLEENWRTTTFNNDYQYHGVNDSDTGIHTVVDNVHALSVRTDAVMVKAVNGLVLKSTGVLRFSGTSQYGVGAQTATFTATNKPGSGTSGPSQWLTVVLGGTNYYIPCFGA